MKLAVLGAGGFGTALSLVLTRAGHEVLLLDINTEAVERWSKQGYSDLYGWLEEEGNHFPSRLTLAPYTNFVWNRLPAKDYDFVIMATSRDGVEPSLKYLELKDCRGLVFLQKGVDDQLRGTAEAFCQTHGEICPVLHFTGAGFAKGIARDEHARMVIGYYSGSDASADASGRFHTLFRGTNIWRVTYRGIQGLSMYGALRTIASFEDGVICGYLTSNSQEEPKTTLANAYAGTVKELIKLANMIGISPALLDRSTPVGSVMEADLLLCRSTSSRNFALGKQLGERVAHRQALSKLEGVAESVGDIHLGNTHVGNIQMVHRFAEANYGDCQEEFPYLHAAWLLWMGKASLDECVQIILARHDR